MNKTYIFSKKRLIIFLIIFILIGFLIGNTLNYKIPWFAFGSGDYCNVVGISIHGEIYSYGDPDATNTSTASADTYSDNLVSLIQDAESNPSIKGLIVSVDSLGGDPVAAEEIANALKAMDKPTVAVIHSEGASAAYWASAGANKIYASKISEVGDIGITSSYVDQSKQDQTNGLQFNQLSTGEFKDMFNPDKPLTSDEKAIIMADLQKTTDIFVQEVANNRHLDLSAVQKLATGRTYLGEDAIGYGLIDAIGSDGDGLQYLTDQMGSPAVVCWE